MLAVAEPGTNETVVAIAVIVVVGGTCALAALKKQGEDLSKAHAVLGTLFGGIPGGIGTYFFTRPAVEQAQKARELAETFAVERSCRMGSGLGGRNLDLPGMPGTGFVSPWGRGDPPHRQGVAGAIRFRSGPPMEWSAQQRRNTMHRTGKKALMLLAAAAFSAGITACGKSTPGEKLDRALEKTGEAVKDTGEAIKPK